MEKLVATRPNATRDFEIGGITFKIGVLPRMIQLEYQDVLLSLLKDMDETDIEGMQIPDDGDISSVSEEKKKSLIKIARGLRTGGIEHQKAMERVVAFGIKGHGDLSFPDGEKVPFTTTKETVGGKELERITDDLLDIYHNLKIIPRLSRAVQNPDEKSDLGN